MSNRISFKTAFTLGLSLIILLMIFPIVTFAEQSNTQFLVAGSYSRSMLKAAWLDAHKMPINYDGGSQFPAAFKADDEDFYSDADKVSIPWHIVDAWYVPDSKHPDSIDSGTLNYLFAFDVQSIKYPASESWVPKYYKNIVYLFNYGISNYNDADLHGQECYIDLEKYFNLTKMKDTSIFNKNVALTLCFGAFERDEYILGNNTKLLVPSFVDTTDSGALNQHFSHVPRFNESITFLPLPIIPILPSGAVN